MRSLLLPRAVKQHRKTRAATAHYAPLFELVDLAGSNPVSRSIFLFNNSSWDDFAPAWSPPDGDRIAFVSTRDGGWQIYLMDTDGDNQENISNSSSKDISPSWSPDGTQIAFTSQILHSNSEIYVMDANGNNRTKILPKDPEDPLEPLEELPGEKNSPVWSPDGNQIAFTSLVTPLEGGTGKSQIHVMDADGHNQRNISNNSSWDDFAPAWSPDGTQIAFTSDRDGYWQIYVMDPDGHNQLDISYDSFFNLSPAWSSDGTQIAFTSDRDGNPKIYVMDADGSNQRNISDNSSNYLSPAWKP